MTQSNKALSKLATLLKRSNGTITKALEGINKQQSIILEQQAVLSELQLQLGTLASGSTTPAFAKVVHQDVSRSAKEEKPSRKESKRGAKEEKPSRKESKRGAKEEKPARAKGKKPVAAS